MKTMLSALSAIAIGLCALAPTTASARPYYHTVAYGARCYSHVPVGCRRVFVHGRYSWYGGRYYGVRPVVVTAPVCAAPSTCEVANDDACDNTTVSCLPTGCSTVYLGGERCWVHNGFYYRHCGYGYTRFHGYYGRGYGARFCGYHGHGARYGHSFRGCHGRR